MSSDPFILLGLDRKTATEADIRKAYAERLKVTRPEDDRAAFMALREAFERARQEARWRAEYPADYEDGDEDADVETETEACSDPSEDGHSETLTEQASDTATRTAPPAATAEDDPDADFDEAEEGYTPSDFDRRIDAAMQKLHEALISPWGPPSRADLDALPFAAASPVDQAAYSAYLPVRPERVVSRIPRLKRAHGNRKPVPLGQLRVAHDLRRKLSLLHPVRPIAAVPPGRKPLRPLHRLVNGVSREKLAQVACGGVLARLPRWEPRQLRVHRSVNVPHCAPWRSRQHFCKRLAPFAQSRRRLSRRAAGPGALGLAGQQGGLGDAYPLARGLKIELSRG